MTTDAVGAVAVDDPGTATLLGVYRRRVRAVRIVLAYLLVMLVLWALLLFLPSRPLSGREVVVNVAAAAMLVWFVAYAVLVLVRLGRWLPVARKLLAQQPWRPVRAQVRTWDRSPVLELEGIGCIRVTRGTTALLRTVELTGTVDVVGPGPWAWAAIRVAGSCWPLPARAVVDTPASDSGVLTHEETAKAADPVTASGAAALRRRLPWTFVGPALITAVGVAFAAVGLGSHDVTDSVLGAAIIVFGVALMVRNLPAVRVVARMPAQLAAAPWTAHPVQLDHWQAPRGFTTATGHLRTSEDDVLMFELPRAGYDLLAAIATTGTMHVAGTPEPGAVLPVRVAQRPVLGYARFRAPGARK